MMIGRRLTRVTSCQARATLPAMNPVMTPTTRSAERHPIVR